MTAVVVDTNVILVANEAHADVSPECVLACVQRLRQLMNGSAIAVDDAFRIVNEYQNKTKPRQGKKPGDVFVKWVLSRLGDQNCIHQVRLTETAPHEFDEFPVPDLAATFDPPDRKFASVAHAHPDKPPILQATDCKWLNWWQALEACGLRVDFLCSTDVCSFYQRKFPGRPVPPLP